MAPIHLGTSDVKINYGVKTAAPTSPSPTEGSEYWHKTENKKYVYNGTGWATFDVTEPWNASNTATHWWTQAGLTGNDGWTAEKGSQNLTRYEEDELVYTATDSDFNNKKSISGGVSSATDACLGTSQALGNGSMWNARNEAFSALIVCKKTNNNHSFGKGDALFTHMDSWATSGNHWSFEPGGDHIWHQGGELWEDNNIGNVPGGVPCTGIYFIKMDSSGNGGAYWFNDGATSWTTLGTASGWPSNGPGSNSCVGLSFFGIGAYSNHSFRGKIADIAYWKGTSLGDTERDRYKDWAKGEYGL